MTLKISISGVRGFVPESLTPEICLDFAKAFGTYLIENDHGVKIKTVVVGTDPRASSEFIKGIIFSGLLSTGCEVIDLGICPTPTVGIMTRVLKADGGIIITASHNPLPWNGLKFVREDGIFLNEKQANKFLKIYETKKFHKDGPRSVTPDSSALDIHINKVLGLVNVGSIKRRKLTVALDCCNGAGSVFCVKLLQKLGCKVEPINCDLSQPFPHDPEPIAKNLVQLSNLVKQKKADIGFALDSDADRLAIISEQGLPIGEEMTLTLATKFVLSKSKHQDKKKKIVITNLSTTNTLTDIVQQYKGTIIRTKIGEVHVAEELKNLKGLIGGEGNGGVIYPPSGFNRDALVAMAIILNFLAAAKKTVSRLVAEIPSYHMIKEKVKCQNQLKAETSLAKVKEAFKGKDLVLTEGIKVILPSGWVHVRASNTEPVIRIIAEAKEKSEAKNLIHQVLKALK
ncbi:phosphoglucosamine mutase [candidate division WOR-1 bacterium RIFOXYB2_FULL_42_35]|uniref:Phosphoglucosamine mutase n=1 Tax=candidate division WOR-1 bacterium RIFOXYC2_FULL_41_25 TaxID=1802586 RepID=A0A1F4TPD2_UNCSA|nr:MAG: phosphoglucosamine mutase [candidate division WOR-1 bacterium RIFOXYA2_FULL_41_14]OGC25068.1 MAG: phosphoglucosamine mutase [candidate division WOR-1 bacterium RIFOXYB2_FULL_42_35]OGC34516.1 MAG: phosphoglucosamine mutase [candidate division WOR-1 bacterium RIFOXYC2_FULL_41_25]